MTSPPNGKADQTRQPRHGEEGGVGQGGLRPDRAALPRHQQQHRDAGQGQHVVVKHLRREGQYASLVGLSAASAREMHAHSSARLHLLWAT